MGPAAHARWVRAPEALKRNLVPDFLARWPRKADGAADDRGGEELGEIKTIQPGPTRYGGPRGSERNGAVNRRAAGGQADADAKARAADIRLNGCGAPNITACRNAGCGCGDNVGPIRRVLRGYKLKGYAVGAYGECSDTVHTLVRRLGRAGVAKWARLLPTASEHGAQGRLTWLLKRNIAMANLRAMARTLLDRLEHVGTGAAGRTARRAAHRARTARATAEEARHQHAAYRQSDHSGAGSRGGFWEFGARDGG